MTIRGERRKGEVLITVDGSPLDWRSWLAVRNHSPMGTGAGLRRLGSGPALALVILLSDAAVAEDRWVLDAGDVLRLAGVGGDGRRRAL